MLGSFGDGECAFTYKKYGYKAVLQNTEIETLAYGSVYCTTMSSCDNPNTDKDALMIRK